MAVTHNNTTVGTTAAQVVAIPAGQKTTAVQVFNNTGVVAFIGDSTVTNSGATIGLRLANQTGVQLWLNPGDEVYACTASSTGTITVLFSGQ